MIPSLHALLKLPIVGVIASLVRSPRAGGRPQRISKSEPIKPLRVYRRVQQIPRRELWDATQACRACEAGSRRCLEGNVRSSLLREKLASARLLWSTHSGGASLRIGAYRSVEGSVWNSTGPVRPICQSWKRSGGWVENERG